MLILLDNNAVDRDDLATYLQRSPANRAAIPHTAFVEWHKGNAEHVTRKVLQQACQHSSRIVVLKDTAVLMRMNGRPSGLMGRLVDERQTADFPSYCQTVICAPESAEISARFDLHRQDVQAYTGEMLKSARGLMRLYALWDDKFEPSELAEMNGLLKRGNALSGALQVKTYRIAEEFALRQLRRHGEIRLARNPAHFLNTLAFRYSATAMAFYINRKNDPGTWPTGDKAVLNHFMDIKIAAQATYFSDFLTRDAGIRPVYEIAFSLVRALGGFSLRRPGAR